ncbi:MAG: hypothetical protein ACKOCX_01125 [Planctomycetota bacterium]
MSKFAPACRMISGLIFLSLVAGTADAGLVGPMAETEAGVEQNLAPRPLVTPRAARVDLVSLPVLYLPAVRQHDAGRVLPDSLTAPAALMPSGTLSWAGIHEAATLVEVQESSPKQQAKRADLRDVASDAAPNVELLTAIPAPEPPAVVLAGLALVAGGLVLNRQRRRGTEASEA